MLIESKTIWQIESFFFQLYDHKSLALCDIHNRILIIISVPTELSKLRLAIILKIHYSSNCKCFEIASVFFEKKITALYVSFKSVTIIYRQLSYRTTNNKAAEFLVFQVNLKIAPRSLIRFKHTTYINLSPDFESWSRSDLRKANVSREVTKDKINKVDSFSKST